MTCVQPSLHEHLFPLTARMKQRVVENFSGNLLCTDRWTVRCFSGSNSSAMLNATGGGFRITTGSTDNAGRAIDFNNKKQYCDSASVFLGVHRGASTASSLHEIGAIDDIAYNASSDFAFAGQRTDHCVTNYEIRARSGAETFTGTCVALDTIYHSHKMELRACDVQYTIDGDCVDATHSTNLPSTGRLHPSFIVQTHTTAVKTGEITYMEVYNT